MRVGILKRHTFPTGGYTEYTYEANQVVRATYFQRAVGESLSTANCSYEEGYCCNMANWERKTITVTDEMLDEDRVTLTIHRPPVESFGSSALKYRCSGTSSLEVYAKAIIYPLLSSGLPDRSKPGRAISIPGHDYRGGSSEVTTLELSQLLPPGSSGAGEYYIELQSINTGAELSLHKKWIITGEIQEVGGLRLTRAATYGTNDEVQLSRTYTYEMDEAFGGGPSAMLVQQPRYTERMNYLRSGVAGGDRFYIRSSSVLPLQNYQGHHVGHSRVIEHLPDGSSVEYKYSAGPTTSIAPTTAPSFSFAAPPVPHDFRWGNLLERNSINDAGTVVRSEKRTYDIAYATINGVDDKGRERQMKSYALVYLNPTGYVTNSEGELIVNQTKSIVRNYVLLTGSSRLASVTVTQDGVTTSEEIVYASAKGHQYPTSIVKSDGNGDRLESRLSYPEHCGGNNDAAVCAELERLHVLQPIRTTQYVNGRPVDGSETRWKEFSGLSVYPSAMYRYEATNTTDGKWTGSWEPKYYIHAYNDQGLPREAQTVGYNKDRFTWTAQKNIEQRVHLDDEGRSKFIWAYRYYGTSGLLRSATTPAGEVTGYTYDGLSRLASVSARDDKVRTAYDYRYYGQDAQRSQNYVKTTVSIDKTKGSELHEVITYSYLDGLGRAVQQVKQQHTDDEKDVVSAQGYDALGRPELRYEAFTSGRADGTYVSASSLKDKPATLTEYYSDPMGRVRSVTPAGWSHSTTYTYGSNTSEVTLPQGTSFAGGSLSVATVVDGNGAVDKTYTDWRGRVVLRERYATSTASQPLSATYTAYDDKDRVTGIFPPGTDNSSGTKGLTYTYRYDGADNVIYKKVPDSEAATFYYDERNLPIYTVDPSVPEAYDYLAMVYDQFGRELQRGFGKGSLPSTALTTIPESQLLTTVHYGEAADNAHLVMGGRTRLIDRGVLSGFLDYTNTYDPYGRLKTTTGNHPLELADREAQLTTFYYDYADNPLKQDYTHTIAGKAFRQVTETTFDHAGRPQLQYAQLTVDGETGPRMITSTLSYTAKDQIATRYIGYTDRGRLLQYVDYRYDDNGLLTSINNVDKLDGDVFALELSYDDPAIASVPGQRNGNISSATVATASGTSYTYGYRYDGLDRLTGSDYVDHGSSGSTGRYNTSYSYDNRGNIKTLSRHGAYVEGDTERYGRIDDLVYTYSAGTNRLASIEDKVTSVAGIAGYDRGGSKQKYTYDLPTGNQTYDPSRDLSTTYNFLNLPATFTLADGTELHYVYAADGSKLRESHVNPDDREELLSQRDYIGPTEYEDGVLSVIHHPDGRFVPGGECVLRKHVDGEIDEPTHEKADEIDADATVGVGGRLTMVAGSFTDLRPGFHVPVGGELSVQAGPCQATNSSWIGEYDLKDHLGNVRAVFADRDEDSFLSASEVRSEFHYYPFGLEMQGAWQAVGEEYAPGRYRYNGKELNPDLGSV